MSCWERNLKCRGRLFSDSSVTIWKRWHGHHPPLELVARPHDPLRNTLAIILSGRRRVVPPLEPQSVLRVSTDLGSAVDEPHPDA